MIKNVQALRGIASMLVMIAHLTVVQPGAPWWLQLSAQTIGPGGVELFFVISGFVILLMLPGLQGPSSLVVSRDFALKRILRIYPVFWAAFIASILFVDYFEKTVWFAAPWDPPPQYYLMQNAMLVAQYNMYVPNAWSLAFEVHFYAVVTFCIFLSLRYCTYLLAVWSVVTAGFIVLADRFFPDWSTTVFASPLVINFMFGMLVAYLYGRRLFIRPWLFVALGSALVLIGAALVIEFHGALTPFQRVLSFGIGSAFILYGTVGLEMRDGRCLPGFLRVLGDISYSLYLWHLLVFAAMSEVLGSLGLSDRIPWPLNFMAFAAAALAVSFISHRYLELPSISLGRSLLSQRRGQPLPATRP